MADDLKRQLKDAMKYHLQQTSQYTSLKAAIAASVYAQMLNRAPPVEYRPVELPNSPDVQTFVFDMITFMRQFGLERTLHVLMLEANIVIDEEGSRAHSAASSMQSWSPSPEKTGEKSAEARTIPTVPVETRKVEDFDGEGMDLGREQGRDAENTQKTEKLPSAGSVPESEKA